MRLSLFLLIISLLLVAIVLGIVFFLSISSTRLPEESGPQVSLEEVTPGQEEFVKNEPPPPSVNPTYTEKIRREPFWEQLPYWTDHFVIEYKGSKETLIIHTFAPATEDDFERLTLAYRQEALTWIRENGGNPNSLPIIYDPTL